MRSPPLALSLILLAALSIMLTLSHGYNGAATSMDSLTYINVARAIAEGKGVVAPNYDLASPVFSPMTLWAPLYPAVLSVLCLGSECTATSVRELSLYLNFILMLGSSLTFLILANKLVNPWLALATTVSLILLPAFQLDFMFLWSETVFIPLILLSLYCLTRYLDNNKSLTMLTVAVALIALATYTRYVGVAFAIALIVSLLFFSAKHYFQRIKIVFISGLTYSILIAPLLTRNFLHSGHLSGGERGTPVFRLQEDSFGLSDLIAQELFSAQPLLLAAWVALACTLIIACRYRAPKSDQASPQAASHHLLVPLLWSLVYLGFLIISRSVQHIDLDTRMISVTLPLLFLGVLGLTNFLLRKLYVAAASFPLIIIMLTTGLDGIAFHQTILKNLRTERSPGYAHYTHHYSITEVRFEIFEDIAQTYEVGKGDMIVTDGSRPQILNYFFGDAIVKSIPYLNGKVDFEAFAQLKGMRILGLISSPALQEAVISHYNQTQTPIRADFVVSPDARFLFVEFPVL